ncbi:Clavaminate synthase-like protein [Xylona heveae TC161]|uniref:Clavaminate synthase-like protein n=1 Tax=Xylona heveae (strain CBS 132557 / TC161) TaxID=1328760 RepID=A0A165GJG9_XYLHT|nr:Clavaminate synthase-like protein [Xylona heveae TC161]KZF22264.1 Clavaminate synthase-like protein [Xylona heveae TC161]
MRLKRFNFSYTLSQCRLYSDKIRPLKHVRTLKEGSVEHFRQEAFLPAIPTLLPRGHFRRIPAVYKWFTPGPRVYLRDDYLVGKDNPIVPLELTRSSQDSFQRMLAPFNLFVRWARTTPSSSPERLYLAQAQVDELPHRLQGDLPTPDLVSQAGKGDIYDTNIWIGLAPTYTPLHRDPNPNLFVQLAGVKVVRLCPPHTGAAIYEGVQRGLGRNGSATIRGDEMMCGEEKNLLENAVWDNGSKFVGNIGSAGENMFYEATLRKGDGLFIPKGWWHSIKGVGEGMIGSVNWWFR